MQEGFVKLPREITSWRWFADANVLRVYIYLLTQAAFKETEWKKENLKKGQLVTGRKKLSAALGIARAFKLEPGFETQIFRSTALKYSQIRKDLLRFCLV